MRSPLSVDWVGLATSKRSPGEVLLRLQRELVGAERPGVQDAHCAGQASHKAERKKYTNCAQTAHGVMVADRSFAPTSVSRSTLRERTT